MLRLVAPLRGRFLLHVDLHETTDSDESEFRPALAARDGKPFEPGLIPDGFYLVDDRENPQPEFQRAIIEAVARITHIAPADDKNEIIGSPVISPGVIDYPLRELGLCAGITGARYTTTTEVYPDSPRATPEQCNAAQVAAVCAAIEFALRIVPLARDVIQIDLARHDAQRGAIAECRIDSSLEFVAHGHVDAAAGDRRRCARSGSVHDGIDADGFAAIGVRVGAQRAARKDMLRKVEVQSAS